MNKPNRPDDPASRIKPGANPRFSRSLEYAFALLECFDEHEPARQIADLAELLGVSRSTTHRYAQTLIALEYLEQDSKRRYLLAPRAAEPGLNAVKTLREETPMAREVLEQLRTETGLTVSMATISGTHALYTERLHAHGPDQYAADLDHGVGAHVPLYCTAIGKALLASVSQTEQKALVSTLTLDPDGPNMVQSKSELVEQLNEIRTVGIATSDEEEGHGVLSIATHVPQPGRSRPLAIAITAPAYQHTMQTLTDNYALALIRAAQRI